MTAAARKQSSTPRPFPFDRRASGLLMRITSLPGLHGSSNGRAQKPA